VPLINYSGSPARWLSSTGNYGGEWFLCRMMALLYGKLTPRDYGLDIQVKQAKQQFYIM